MIQTFADSDTRRIWDRVIVRRWSVEIQRAAYRKLVMIDAAQEVRDLLIPPGNKLEKLVGDRAGQHSIRINRQWRICFNWRNNHAEDVEITDYH